MILIWAIALAKLFFHIYFNNRYGYFRDEFDYMSCGDHLQWGYVDQPPLIPFLIHICRAVLGDSLRAIRFIPAVASSLLVVQTAVLARELGGRRYAMLLSAICSVIALQYLSNGSSTRHQLPRTQSVDGLRLLRDSRHQEKRSALLAVVWRLRRPWDGEQIFHGALRLWNRRWAAADRAATDRF